MLHICTVARAARKRPVLSASLHSLTADALKSLDGFPEYVSSAKHLHNGMLDQSVADMRRVVDVLQSSMGATNRLTIAANIKLASVNITKGDMLAAEKALALPIAIKDISSADDAANALCLLQAGAACRVLAGDISAAAQLLTDCDELSSSQLDDGSPYHEELLTFGHSLKSVVSGYAGDFGAATTAAWLARDSARSDFMKLLTTANLGGLQTMELTANGLWAPLSCRKEPTSKGHLSSDAEEALRAAIDVWTSSMPASIAEELNALDDKSNEEATALIKQSAMLQQQPYAVLLSHFLANRSEVYTALQEKEGAAADAALALGVLDNHLGDEEGDGSSPAAVVAAVGRAVTILGHRYMEAAEGVSAEGFFRKAVACLTETRVIDDPRYKADAYAAMSGYAQLLSKWERREEHGRQMAEKADKHVGETPVFAGGVRLGNVLILPPLF